MFFCSILQVFTEYFKELEEESIRDNFVIIYELLDELMDFGYPQVMATDYVKKCVVSYNELLLWSNPDHWSHWLATADCSRPADGSPKLIYDS